MRTLPGKLYRTVLLTTLCLAPATGFAAADGELQLSDRVVNGASGEESSLVAALGEIRENRLDLALSRLEELIERRPNFRLAQLIYADLLISKAGPIDTFGGASKAPLEVLSGLRDEARLRLRHHLSQPPRDSFPESLLKLSESQARAVVVDVAESRFYLFENRGGLPHLVKDYYVSTGKNGPMKLKEGDQKTPLGVYFVTGRIPPQQLPDLYGSGAFPVNYPNEWDQRQGRTGYGIWIHGVPTDTYSRPPRASDGCLAVSNEDLQAMWNTLGQGHTPVIIADGLKWVSPDTLTDRFTGFRANLERWRDDWESLKHDRYASHYSKSFKNGTKDYAAWMTHKRKVNANKRFVKVKLSDVSMFAYPGESGMVVVTFDQDYNSSNYKVRLKKRQYWQREEDGVWRIIYEGAA